jgi:chromosome segregation ATPase
MPELICEYCQAENPSKNVFCGECGARLRPEVSPDIARLVDGAVERQVAEALDSRLKDQKVVEVEVAEQIAERTIKWAKLAGYFIGIPVALLASLLAFLGIRTYSDLENLTNTLDKTRIQVESAQTDAHNAKSQAQAILGQIQAQESDLREQVVGVRGRLVQLEEELRAVVSRGVV